MNKCEVQFTIPRTGKFEEIELRKSEKYGGGGFVYEIGVRNIKSSLQQKHAAIFTDEEFHRLVDILNNDFVAGEPLDKTFEGRDSIWLAGVHSFMEADGNVAYNIGHRHRDCLFVQWKVTFSADELREFREKLSFVVV